MTDPTSLTELPDVDTFVSTVNEGDYTNDQKNFLLQKYQDTALNLAKDNETINTARESQAITDEESSTIPVSENYDSFSRYVLGGINKAKLDVNKDRAQEVYRSTIRERYQNEEEFNTAANNIAQYEQFGGPPVDNVIKDMGAAQRAVNEELRISGAYNQVGSMRDSVDNPLARFNVLYNSSNSPEYARITLHNEGEFIDDPETADFLSFPKGFDPVTAYVDSLKRQQRELIDQAAADSYNPLDTLTNSSSERMLEAKNIENQIKMSEQLIQAKNQGFIEEASQKGVEAYVQQYIRDQAEAGNPKYQNIGQGFLEGSLATVWGGVRRAYLSGQASLLSLREQGQRAMLDVAQSIAGDNPELQQRISPGVEGVSREAEIINLQRGKLSSRAQEIGREQRFSGLEVTSPFAGEMLRDVADAVYQGGESVVTSGVGALVGGPVGAVIGATGYAYLQASGNKALELSALERQRRKEGDIDGANYIRDNQGYLSILSGATEALTERFSPGDVAFGALNRSRRAITSGLGEIAGEGLEEATAGLADAVQGFYLEGKSAEETAEAFATLPKQAVLGAVGAVLPVGIRSLRGLGKNKSDEVDRQVIKDVVQTKLQEIDAVAQEQNITREEAAQVVVNNREEAIRRANEYASVTEGNLGDEPRVDIINSRDLTPSQTGTTEQVEGTPDFSFTTGDVVPSFVQDEAITESAPTTDEFIEVGIDAQGDDAPIVIETEQQAASDLSPAVTEIQEARGFIQSLSTPQEGREQETIDAVSNLSPEALNDLSSFVSSNFQRDPNPEVLSFQLPPQEGQAQEYDPSQVAVISDRHGNTRLISTPSLIEKINSGEIDPKNNYFYLSSSLRGENASPELSSALDSIPSRNVVNFTPEQVGYRPPARARAQAQAEAPTATPAPQAEGEAQAQEGEQPVQEAEATPSTPVPSPIDGVIAYAATVRARGREALAESTVEDAIRGRDVQNEVREAEFENRQLFSADRSEYEQGYKFNGTQQDLDGNPFLDLYTIYDESHPFNGSTISVRHGTPASGVLDYIEQKRNQQFSPDRNTIDDVFAQLNTGNAVEVSQLTERLAGSRDKIIATTARLLSQAPQNAVEGVQVRRDKNVRRSYYQRQNEYEGAEIVLGRNAGEDVILHEVVHAYTDPLIEQEMGDLLRNAVTGSDYKAVLDNYLKNGKNKKLKTVIRNYIAIVNALGYSDSVFGNARRSTSAWNGDPLHYGLQDIREFCSEVVMEPELISRINAIQNPFQESLFKRLIRSILDFFSSTLLKGYTPFYNRVFSDLITFVNEGHAITPREKEIINRTPPALNTDLTREIDLATQIAEKGTLNDFDKSTLSGLNHRKAKASPAIKDTTIYVRPVTRDELLNTRRVKSRRSDTAIDVTLESTIDQMMPEGLAMIWDEKANGGSFISILDDGSLSPGDIDTLKERGIDVMDSVNPDRLYSKESESAGTKRPRRAPSPTRELEGITFNNEFLTTDQKRRINSIRSQLTKGTIPSEVALTELREIKESSDTAEFASLKSLYPEALAGKDIDNLTDAQVAVIDWLEDNHRDPENLDHPKRTKARIQKVLDFRDQVQALQEGGHAAFNSISDPRITSIINESIDFMLNNFNPREISNRQLTAWTKALRLFNESEGRNISGFSRTAAKIATSKIIKRLEDGKRKAGVGFEETPSFKVFGAPISNVRRGALYQSKTGIALSDVTTELDAIFNRKDTKDAIISILSDYHTSLNDFNVMEDNLLTSYKNRIKEIQDRYKSRGKPTLLDDSKIQIVKRVTQFEIGAKTTPLQQIRNNLAQELTSIDRKKKAEGNQRAIDEGIIDEQAYRDVAQSLADQIDNQIITDESTAIDFIEDQLDSYQLEILRLIREPGTQYWNQLDTVNQLSVGIPGSTRKQLRPWANYAKRSQRPLRTETFSNFWGEAGFNSALSVLQQRQGLGEDKKNVFTSSWQTDLEQQLTETAYEITTGPARVQLFQAFRDQQMVDTLDNGVPTAPRTDRMKQQLGNIHSFTRNQELRLPDLLQTVVATTSWVQALNLFNITQPLNQLIPALLYIGKRPTILWNTVRTRIGAKSGKKAQDDFIQKYSPFLYKRMNHYEQLVEKQRTKWQRRGMETGIDQLDTLSRDIIRNLSKFWKNTSDIAQYIGTIPTHVAVGLSEAFSAKAVFMSIYANELAERGLISDPNDFLYGRNMVYDRDVITFAELELERYILTPLNTALRGEMWQKTSLGKEVIRQGAFSLSRTSIQQSLKSTTSVRDTHDAIKDHLRTGTAESKEHVRNKLEDFAVQQMQMALYYGVRLISMSINTSLGASATFIAAAALQGDDDDKEEWMRRYRVLNRVYGDQSETYLFQQFLTDLAYQYFPVGHLQNNIGRAFIQNIFSFFQSWPFNDERLKSDIEDLEATSKILDKRIKDYEKLGQTNKAIDLDVAREYVETTLTASKEALRNKASFLTKLTDNITGNILPVTDEFRQRAKALEEIIVPRNDELAQQMIKESKSNQAWWAISWALSIASPSRRASERAIKERAQADYKSRKGEERRYNEGTEALNDTDRTQNIDIPEGFEETVPARLYE